MSTDPAAAEGECSRIQQRQLTLDDFHSNAGRNRCEAIAEYTGEQCRHDALPGSRYCADHYYLTDDEEVL